jgi:RimJ/RimL family protein N-acetyltransferase
MDEFETARLRMRPLMASDQGFYCGLYTDAGMMRHIAQPMSADAALRSFETVLEMQGKQRLTWVIHERESQLARGILGVFPAGCQAEVGVMLVPEAQARGFAAEVISAIADRLLLETSVERLWTRHAAANRAACVLMQKMTFDRCDDGQPPEEMRWQLTRRMWSRGKGTVAAVESSR